jgi:threonine synthase
MEGKNILQSIGVDFTPRFELNKYNSRKPNLWRYREAIPIKEDNNIISFEEGFTPLLPIDFNGKKIYVKQDYLFPTGSYKDRGASVLMSHAKEIGIKHCVQDSSGNAGCAIAAYSALAGICCDIFVPASTSAAKLKQIESYGAALKKIEGSREDTAAAAKAAVAHTFYASHCYNNYFYQGTKTFAYEVCEQLHWQAPDAVVLPAGNGTLVLGCYVGFTDLLNAGIISKMPKIIAVQAENCSPLAQAFNKNESHYTQVKTTETFAEGIAIAKPHRGNEIMQIVKLTNGCFVTVNETEIATTWKETAAKGFYIEPTSAATIAGMKKYTAGFDDKTIVTLFTGNGLKK